MATSSDLLILFPDIPQAATRFNNATTFAGAENQLDFYPMLNTFRGARWQLAKSSGNAAEHATVYDLGPYVTKSANFMLWSRLDIMKALAAQVRIKVDASADDSSYTNVVAQANIDALTLLGPQSNDYVEFFAATGNYRYFRWIADNNGGATAFAMTIGKVYFGTYLDLGVGLDDYSIEYVLDSNPQFDTAAGDIFLGKTDQARMKLQLVWYGVTDAKVKEFFDNVYSSRLNTPAFLYTQTYHDPLDAKRLLCCALISAKSENRDEKDDFNTLTTNWIEMVG